MSERRGVLRAAEHARARARSAAMLLLPHAVRAWAPRAMHGVARRSAGRGAAGVAAGAVQLAWPPVLSSWLSLRPIWLCNVPAQRLAVHQAARAMLVQPGCPRIGTWCARKARRMRAAVRCAQRGAMVGFGGLRVGGCHARRVGQ